MKLTITIATLILLQTNVLIANDIKDLGKKTWKETKRVGKRVVKEIKRFEKRVEKEINRTDENLSNIYHKTEDVLEEAWRDTREEVNRWGDESEDWAINNEQIQWVWHLKEYKNGNIACRPIDITGQALKHLLVFKRADYEYITIRKAGTVMSAFTSKPVPKWELRYKKKKSKE